MTFGPAMASCFEKWDENWKPIPGYTEFGYPIYFASVRGEVCRLYYSWSGCCLNLDGSMNGIPVLRPRRIYRPSRTPAGYYTLKLAGRTVSLHVVIALAWHGLPPPGLHVLHCDGDKDNNRPNNLRYGTRSENMQDRWLHWRQRVRSAA